MGNFEFTVLKAVILLRGDGYGMTVRQVVSEQCQRDVSIGALYTTLTRLEEKQLISSFVGDPTPERGGRAKRYFKVTSDGVRAAREAEEEHERLWSNRRTEQGA